MFIINNNFRYWVTYNRVRFRKIQIQPVSWLTSKALIVIVIGADAKNRCLFLAQWAAFPWQRSVMWSERPQYTPYHQGWGDQTARNVLGVNYRTQPLVDMFIVFINYGLYRQKMFRKQHWWTWWQEHRWLYLCADGRWLRDLWEKPAPSVK